MFAGKVDYASCEADWALPGASVGREEALADALALKRVAPDAAGNMWQQGFENRGVCCDNSGIPWVLAHDLAANGAEACCN